ncbi:MULTISPECIES: hypothetical protein [Bacillus]|uniref:hypothetical protein n=1 Tax=Bacillus TaxID=1386 RepID=UPI000BB88251|nr:MULTISPECIES: hypothetical protein [Bacillus]
MSIIKSNWKLSIFFLSLIIFLITYFIDDFRWKQVIKHNEEVTITLTTKEEGNLYKVLIELNKPLKSKINTLKVEFTDMELIESDYTLQGLTFELEESKSSYKEKIFVIQDKNRLKYELKFQKDEFSRGYRPLVLITSSKKMFDKKSDTLITRYAN